MYIFTTMKRECLECGIPIFGRSDKKYCSDSCRNSRNNRLNSEENKIIWKTNRKLKKNHTILTELLTKNVTKIGRQELQELGFYLSYYTHTRSDHHGVRWHYVYNLKYRCLPNDYIMILTEEQ